MQVTPPLSLPAGASAPVVMRAASRSLPLAVVPRRSRDTVYAFTVVDGRGRLGDATVVRALGWAPGDHLGATVTDLIVVVTADPDGAAAVSGQGYVHLPASVRRAAGIVSGERVLLAAEPGRGTLLVHPLAVVDSMITERQARLAGGERA